MGLDMDREFVIRRVRAGDREGVTRELGAYLVHIGEDLDVDGLDHDIAHWEVEYDGRAGILLVVESEVGEIVGTAAVRRLDVGVAEIKRMWVRPACQGHGLGRRLMGRCLEEARGLGYRSGRRDWGREVEGGLTLSVRSGLV